MSATYLKTDILIIGGGLAGLSIAERLHQADRDFLLLEARSRFGGRIRSDLVAGEAFDLGPAWIWHGQPRIAELLKRFSLEVFDQFSEGLMVFEDPQGRVQRDQGYGSMQGSLRVEGGLGKLVDALAGSIPDSRKFRGAMVTEVTYRNPDVIVQTADDKTISCNRVVLAMPPRIAEAKIEFFPPLPADTTDTMARTPTWMAGQAKAVATYDTPFWHHEGLSGDAMSRRGPLVEIHDASPRHGKTAALFGFIGIPAQHRSETDALKSEILAQLARLFGPLAARPAVLIVKDWALDPHTATPRDLTPIYEHPRYGMPPAFENLWDGALNFGGTEVALEFGGFLEGALEAADAIVNRLR